MRTCRFVLAPRGTGLHSFRLLEILSAGAVPVIVADGAVKPFSSVLRWGQFSVDVREAKVAALPAILRAIPEPRWRRLRDTGRCVYERYFASEDWMLRFALEILRKGIERVVQQCHGGTVAAPAVWPPPGWAELHDEVHP
eukprot:EG_transcript_33752